MKSPRAATSMIPPRIAASWPTATRIALLILTFPGLHSPASGQSLPAAPLVSRVIDSNDRPQAFAPGIVSTPYSEWATSFTPDGKAVYFSQGAKYPTVVYSRKKNDKWQKPAVASFSGRYNDWDPFVTPDGKRMVFVSNRPHAGAPADQPQKHAHIWYADYISQDTWGTPTELDSAVNRDDANDYAPCLSSKGTLYYCSRRKGFNGMQSFYHEWLGDHYGPAQQVLVPGAEHIQDPFIAPDESYLVFVNSDVLYISFKQGGGWSTAQNLGPQVNNGEGASSPYISADNKTLYYTSNRMEGFYKRDLTRSALDYDGLLKELNSVYNNDGNILMIPIHLDRAGSVSAASTQTGSSSIAAAAAAASPTGGPIPQLFAPGIISGPADDAAPVFTPDGKTVYFHRRGTAFGAVMLAAHWQDGKWSEPDIAPFSGQWSDIEPAMAPDGSYMIFSSNRPVTPGGQPLDGFWNGQAFPRRGGNLWRVDRDGDTWGQPYRLPESINAGSTVFAPAITADGSLYFMKSLGDTGKFHIYYAPWRNGQFAKPEPVSFSAPNNCSDFDPAVAPDESFMIFGSSRPTAKSTQLFIVYRQNDNWGIPIPLGEEINRPAGSNNEPRLSPDHRTLYFSSAWAPPVIYPSDPDETRKKMLESAWFTGQNNIWSVPLGRWLTPPAANSK